MSCKLPAPQWTSTQHIGLKSAVENLADGYVNLEFADALPVHPGNSIYYLIYYSTTPDTLFAAPKLVATSKKVSVPGTLISLNNYISVHVAQLGVAHHISAAAMTKVADNLFLYPAASSLAHSLGSADTHVVTHSSAGFPLTDGYLKVEDEIILYSSIVDGYDGYQGFVISSRDPFGCNLTAAHPDGYQVSLFRGFEDLNAIHFKTLASSGMPSSTWEDPFLAGIKTVEDLGIGTSVKIYWYDGKPPKGFSRAYFNIYQSTSLNTLFSSGPIGFSTNLNAIIPNLDPGKIYYYGVRIAYQLTNLTTSGFDNISSGVFKYPAHTVINELDGYFRTTDTGNMFVSSTDGFPLQGFIQVGSEVMQYDSITSTSFHIIDRDLFSVNWVEDYPNGKFVRFFKGIEDNNRRFFRGVPSWDAGLDTPRMPLPDGYNNIPADGYDGYAYNQDSDGYRSVLEDVVTENHSVFEINNSTFDQFPYSGYRSPNFVKLLSGKQCGTYQGGRTMTTIAGVNNGNPVPVAGGVNIFTASQQREEVILGLSSEPFILLRRRTTGKKCPRLSLRSEHPNARCGTCFGTTFLGGYDRIVNERQIRPAVDNPNGFIAMRVSPYNNDLELTPDRGLAQNDQFEVWTIAVPIIKDRDILIRYTVDERTNRFIEEFRYEVLTVNRNKLLFGKDGKQTATIKKLDKEREIYKYRITLV